LKIIVDDNIPFGNEMFSTLGDVLSSDGREITQVKVNDADVLIVRSITKVDESLLKESTVKFVGTVTIGFDHIDINYLGKRNIPFESAPGSNSNSVAEYVICALLTTVNKLNINLKDLTLGIIGVGNIGSKVEKNARALGMNVILNDPPLYDSTGDNKYRPLGELLSDCDIITYHVPLTKEGKYPTFHMIDYEFLSKLKKKPIIINTSRGSIASTNDLKKTLHSGYISHIILDVWENEPNIDIELLKMSLLGTPHIAGHSLDGKVNGAYMIYQSLCQHLNKNPVWDPKDHLPKSNVPIITIEKLSNSLEKNLFNVLSQVYNIEKDSLMLRKIINLPVEKQGNYFENLRKNYPVRREFFNTEILFKDKNTKMSNILSGIGFKIVN
jgi:erythronate-4-phosphate dehydrogenase